VQERIAGLGNPRIVYRKRVPHNQVKAYYSVIECLVYARRRMRLTELVTPLKPLEAMTMGKVVVASDIGGHREMVQSEETGLLYNGDKTDALVNALCRIAGDPDLRSRLAAAGREYVLRERSWRLITENHLRAYDYAMRTAGQGGSGSDGARN
jgi:glycosyltransferase involved in cell wall biosynthesis